MRTNCAILIWLLSAASGAADQQYSISTIGGGPPLLTSQPASIPAIGFAISVTADTKGNVYFASADLNSVFRLDANGTVIRIAGNTIAGFSGDGGEATSAELSLSASLGVGSPGGLAVDSGGNLFIADMGNNRIRRVSSSGVITTVAGPGKSGFYGDGGPAVGAELRLPTGIALDNAGNLFFSERGTNRVRKIAVSGIITTVAGGGNGGFAGDGGPATSALLAGPAGLALDANGNLFIADSYNNRVRRRLAMRAMVVRPRALRSRFREDSRWIARTTSSSPKRIASAKSYRAAQLRQWQAAFHSAYHGAFPAMGDRLPVLD